MYKKEVLESQIALYKHVIGKDLRSCGKFQRLNFLILRSSKCSVSTALKIELQIVKSFYQQITILIILWRLDVLQGCKSMIIIKLNCENKVSHLKHENSMLSNRIIDRLIKLLKFMHTFIQFQFINPWSKVIIVTCF